MAFAITLAGLTAGSPAYADLPPPDAGRQLQIAVSGHITPKCSLMVQGPTSLSFGAIMDSKNGSAADASLDVPFSLECNSPYTASLTSKNGGLAFEGPPADKFANSVGYAVRVSLSSRAGGLSLSCTSAEMRGDVSQPQLAGADGRCKTHSGGYGAGDGKMNLTIRGGGLPLLRGTYSDQLVLLVSPDLGG